MDPALKERHGHLFIAKDLRPPGKSRVGGNSDAGALKGVTEELEEQLRSGLGEGQVSYLIDQHQVKKALLCQQARQPLKSI